MERSYGRAINGLGAGLGVGVLLTFLLLPPLESLTPLGMKVLGVFLFTALWWAFVDTAFSSFLCVALFALVGIMAPNEVFAAALGNWLVIFLIGCFGLTEAIRVSGFVHRFALWFLSRPFATGRPFLLLTLFFLGVTFMGAIMSPTVTIILFMSLMVPMLEAMGYKRGDHFPAMLIMGTGWVSLAAFMMTPIGHVSNVMYMEWIRRDAGYALSFPAWLIVGVPVGLLFYFLLLGFFRYVVRPDMGRFSAMADEYVRREAGKMGPMKLEEKITLWVFFGVVMCWMLPGIAGNLLPGVSAYLDRMGYAIPLSMGN